MKSISKDRERYYIADFQLSNSLPRYYYEVKKLSKLTYGYYSRTNEELVRLYNLEKNNIKKIKIVNTIVNKNLSFVLMIAKRYTTNIDLLPDVINVGNIGLIKAISKYKENNGSKFITCAVWWVRMEINKFINYDNKLITINSGQKLRTKKIEKIEKDFLETYGVLPSQTEVIDSYNEIYGTSLEEHGIGKGIKVSSLDLSTNNTENLLLSDLIEDETLNYTEKNIDNDYNKETIKYLLKKLSNREKVVLSKIFGLNGKEPIIEENIAEEMNLTEVRIGQIRKNALEKLKTVAFLEFI